MYYKMAKSDKNDLTLVNMPRMARRNAVAYPSRILNDDGAFSPINLLNRSSVSDIDPRGMIAQELRVERRIQAQSKGAIPATPVTSVLDGWKKLHDAKSNAYNGIERLFEPPDSSTTVNLTVAGTKRQKTLPGGSVNNQSEKEQADRVVNFRGNPVIPWKKQSTKPTTVAEERRKLFESFDLTSIEPPETPQVSELTLRKRKLRRRRKDSKALRSQESVVSSVKPKEIKEKENKAPFSNVPPKVNTRWDKSKVENVVQKNAKNQNSPDPVNQQNDREESAGTTPVNEIEKPSISNRTKNNVMKPLLTIPLKAQVSKTDKLVTNYPAAATVKNVTDKLPLTIAPRYNAKKVMGLTSELQGTKNEARGTSDVSSKLHGVIQAHQKPKFDEQVGRQGPGANSLRSTFLNLQRINNAGAASGPIHKRASSTGGLVVSRQSASILGSPTIGVPKKPTPLVTTIQAPPAFLASKISVQSQMTEIPINGERVGARVPSTSRGYKRDIKDVSKSTKVPNKPRTPLKNTKQKPESPPIATKVAAKVVPTLGALPNKYNNIYIGPYSGSESDGEPRGSSKKR